MKVEQLELVFSFPEFEGPLDLLVYLVRKHRVDIRSIPITVIADEFIAHVNKMKSLDMVVTSDFLVMASTLMEMKSKALLPRMSNNEAEVFENQQKELYKSVEEYKALKDLSKEFRVKLYDAYSYERATAKPVVDQKRKEDLPDELTEAFKAILKETVLRERVYTIVSESINVEDRMLQIEQLYETIELYKFLMDLESRSEVIVSFLAVLELLKLNRYYLESVEPLVLRRRV
ncbi:chromosome segregation and condensation protein ScpA [Mesotoga sp. Brook.08.105.5.1]|nr:chromosome segregation and condensation protein ScpA [Mesotoga sp. Brook.08.105.5.1]RDI92367.1 chromosome segregation protein ScpA [Mesotoga sp. Brook.08.YT.4.2.5.2.]